MSFEAQFLSLMPHTITLTAPTGRNAQGTPTYVGGTAVAYRARIIGDLLALRTLKIGVETQAFIVYAAVGSDPVTSDYLLALPADQAFGTGTPFIYAVERLSDGQGHHHTKLICGFTFHHQTKL